MKILNCSIVFVMTSLFFNFCGISNEILEDIEQRNIYERNCPDINYKTVFPTATYYGWLPSFEELISDIPPEVSRNQVATSGGNEEHQDYWCYPSARPFAHLDSNTKIKGHSLLVGNWQITCSRTILYKDSLSYIDSNFYRSSDLIVTNSTDKVLLTLSDKRIALYVKSLTTKNKYKSMFNRRYRLLNGRYLLVYNIFRTTSGTSFVGITEKGELILNQYSTEMYNYTGKHKIWKTTCIQMVFQKCK